MRKPRENPTEKRRRSAANKGNTEDSQRTIPGKRTPEYERLNNRVVNEDEQQKAVNNSEDNAQSSESPRNEDPSDAQSSGRPGAEKNK